MQVTGCSLILDQLCISSYVLLGGDSLEVQSVSFLSFLPLPLSAHRIPLIIGVLRGVPSACLLWGAARSGWMGAGGQEDVKAESTCPAVAPPKRRTATSASPASRWPVLS